jgi:flagellar motor protein MotB
VAPLHYDEASLEVTPGFLAQIERTLANLGDRQNVVVKFIGYTDSRPLAEREARIYGDHESLSKARARRVALAVGEKLGLPAEAVESDGHGTSRALASNETPQGRAQNRRIEVEFWYDDALQELPDEPQLCPADAAAETVTRVYRPAWGDIPALALEQGRPVVPPDYLGKLERALADVSDKARARLRFVGYTANEGLDRRTAKIYGDDVGLSTARARRTMATISEQLGLAPEQAEHEGRGYVQSDDVVNAGFVQGERSYVKVEVVYDELAVLDDYEGIAVQPLTRELTPENPFALNLMRITVDGKPIDDPNRSSADVQRCTDVAMEGAGIRFGYDNLNASPRLSVAASTETVQLHTINPMVAVTAPVRFRMYSNYAPFIERSEVRIFDGAASTETAPLAVVDVGPDSYAEWRPDVKSFRGPSQELKYVLRAYGADGAFDETRAQPLWVVHSGIGPAELMARANATATSSAAPAARTAAAQGESVPAMHGASAPAALASYGDNALAMQNIPLSSGTVRVQGRGLSPDRNVYVAGAPTPVDARGNFVAETILPHGMHTVEVASLSPEGSGELYLRDLELERNDWFYAGLADLTWSQNNGSGDAKKFVGEDAPYDYDSSLDGRLAFFSSGKFGDGWGLTASVDTREDELGNLFSNFLSKEPDQLFRRIDPDYHFPTFGDDGTVEELAPTEGKLYLALNHGDDYGKWGNFDVGYMNNELAQVDRGLYGGQGHFESDVTTSFGEKKLGLDLFAAEPGTIPSRQDFRGTGGSFYYLHHQDILTGSERVRIEVRDKASGIVTGVVHLSPAVDYDIDYLQGTILLSEPLGSTVDDDLLVRSGSLSGDEAYLVVNYEYTPGFEEMDALSMGGQMHYWLNDHLKVGLMANDNSDDADSSLQAADVTYRHSAASWVKVQTGRSEGVLAQSLVSNDGGYAFQGVGDATLIGADASAYRGDISIGLGDVVDGMDGKLNLYGQTLEAGYSAPGLEALMDTDVYGGAFDVVLTDEVSLRGKSDSYVQDGGMQLDAHELNVGYALGGHWGIDAGVRYDNREDDSGLVLPTQETGDRTDAVLQLGYDPRARWSAYGFVQDTVAKSDTREDNGRVGVGGSYMVSDKLRMDAEVSGGDLGAGGKLGTSYMHSERTNVYLNYALEDERTDNALRSTRGGDGSLVTGMKTRFSDSASVYLEERYQHGNSLTGLTHATGVNLAPNERLNLSATTDVGTLTDAMTGAETDRIAGGVRLGYGFDTVQLSTGVEYRDDESQQLDKSVATRETWLYRNTFRWQITDASRLLGKVNYATSTSSLGNFYDGEYTEAVLGYAFRPVRHDRLNAMVKYTYFYNVPTTDQVTQINAPAEYIQKSHVAALDLTYDLTSTWSVGGKYAYRMGEISLDRDDPEFFDNAAMLYVLRTDYRFREKWEVLLEGRLLDMPDLEEQRAGALVAVSRYVGENFKVGAGYNFTDFSDDLTDLSFDHQGLFLNLTGAL